MTKNLRLLWLLLCGISATLTTHQARASHAIGSDMNYISVGPNLYVVSYRFYRDCSGIPAPNSFLVDYVGRLCGPNGTGTNPGGSVTLPQRDFVDGNPYCRRQNSLSPCDPSGGVTSPVPNYQVYTYQGIVDLGPGANAECSEWRISTFESARPDVENLDAEGNLYSFLYLNNRDVSEDSSPAFPVGQGFKPLIFTCDSATQNIGSAVTDPEGDSLVYTLAPAYQDVPGPGTAGQCDYVAPFTPTSPIRVLSGPGALPFTLDRNNGKISFTADRALPIAGSGDPNNKFVVVIQVDAYRRLPTGVVVRTSTVRRDILLVIFTCADVPSPPQPPQPGDTSIVNTTLDSTLRLTVTDTLEVDACAPASIGFQIIDINGDSITVDVAQGQLPGTSLVQLTNFQFNPGVFSSVDVTLLWSPDSAQINRYYNLTFNISDNGCPLPTFSSLTLVLHVIKREFAAVGLQTQTAAGADDTVCLGQFTTLVATTQRPATYGLPPRPARYTYAWHPDPTILRTNADTAVVRPLVTTRYKVDVVSPQGCVDTASVLVVVDPTNIARAETQTDTTCLGGTAQLRATPRPRTTGPNGEPITYRYAWTNPDATLSDTTIANPIARPLRDTRYQVTIYSSLGCTDTASVLVRADPTNVASISSVIMNDSVCRRGRAQLEVTPRAATIAPNGMPIVYTYRWAADTTLSDTTSRTPVVRPFQTTRYSVTVFSSYGCTDTASVVVRVDPLNVATATKVNLAPDAVICPGTTAGLLATARTETIDASGQPIVYTYRWAPDPTLSATDIPNPVASPPAGSNRRYFVTVYSSVGCTDTASVLVRTDVLPITPQLTDPQAAAFPDVTLGQGQSQATLDVKASNDDGTFIYTITPTEGLDNPSSSAPTVRGLVETTTYNIRIENANGCFVERTLTVNVPLQIPNIITPNNDDVNDKLVIFGPSVTELQLFNRWGREVYSKKPYDNSWDGKDLPSGTYYYLVKDLETGKSYKGWVEVVK